MALQICLISTHTDHSHNISSYVHVLSMQLACFLISMVCRVWYQQSTYRFAWNVHIYCVLNIQQAFTCYLACIYLLLIMLTEVHAVDI